MQQPGKRFWDTTTDLKVSEQSIFSEELLNRLCLAVIYLSQKDRCCFELSIPSSLWQTKLIVCCGVPVDSEQ